MNEIVTTILIIAISLLLLSVILVWKKRNCFTIFLFIISILLSIVFFIYWPSYDYPSNIINAGNLMVNGWIINTPDGLVAIDSTFPGLLSFYNYSLKIQGFKLSDIKYIVLTHSHDDHVGEIQNMIKFTNAKVITHPKTLERLKTGERTSGYCPNPYTYPFALLSQKHSKSPPIDIGDRGIEFTGEQIEGFPGKLMMLPGHTDDSIGLIFPDGNLFCGDAAMNGMMSYKKHSMFIMNKTVYQNSWDKMIASKPTMIYAGHGAPFSVEELVKNRHHLDEPNRMLKVGRETDL